MRKRFVATVKSTKQKFSMAQNISRDNQVPRKTIHGTYIMQKYNQTSDDRNANMQSERSGSTSNGNYSFQESLMLNKVLSFRTVQNEELHANMFPTYAMRKRVHMPCRFSRKCGTVFNIGSNGFEYCKGRKN